MKHYGITHTALVPRILRSLEEKLREKIDALPEKRRFVLDALMQVNELATMRTPRPGLSRTLLKPIHDRFGGRLKLIFAGGAYVERELADFFYRLGIPVVIGYGLTEACTVLTVNDLKPFRPDTVGSPVDGVELEVRDVGPDGVGEVYARGPTIMRGYLDAPELTEETLVDGWLRTGDLGLLDPSGHLKLVGRAKNMIVTEGGKNVYAEDVEAAFVRVPCEELCVFATGYLWPARSLVGETLTLVVRPKRDQNREALLEELSAHNRGLPEHKRVARFLLWDDEFPVTASQKVKRAVLAEQVRERVSAPDLARAS
jgi:long-chain acyl-CoA synthetase